MPTLPCWLALPSLFLLPALVAAQPPTLLLHPNVNSAFSLPSPGGQPFYRLVAQASPDLPSCAASAAAWRSSSAPLQRCLSATFFRAPRNASLLGQCWCYVQPKWVPLASPEADSAQLVWPCAAPVDCSMNGQCSASGTCACDVGWRGPRCAQLDLLPVEAARPGLRLLDAQGGNISTWGAPMLQDPATGTWHAWASEMLHGCGINSWTTNSHIVHATAQSPGGPWTRREEVVPAFAHEPDVVRGPSGELVMVYSYWALPNASQGACTDCANGVTLRQDVKNGCGPNRIHPFRQMMAVAPGGFEGAWGAPVEIPQLSVNWDWNFALSIFSNGSAVGALRALFPWRAALYSDAASWQPVGGRPQGPALPDSNVEDPALWVDRRGGLHAIFHDMDVAGQGQPYLGGHAFSADGAQWTYTGTAYGNSANFTDGTWQTFARRERPHLLFAADGYTPVALSNGVQFAAPEGVACSIGGVAATCDPVFTLVTPINSSSSSSSSSSSQ
jgi:hypothetical protein